MRVRRDLTLEQRHHFAAPGLSEVVQREARAFARVHHRLALDVWKLMILISDRNGSATLTLLLDRGVMCRSHWAAQFVKPDVADRRAAPPGPNVPDVLVLNPLT
jgi:hypothetical protein